MVKLMDLCKFFNDMSTNFIVMLWVEFKHIYIIIIFFQSSTPLVGVKLKIKHAQPSHQPYCLALVATPTKYAIRKIAVYTFTSLILPGVTCLVLKQHTQTKMFNGNMQIGFFERRKTHLLALP